MSAVQTTFPRPSWATNTEVFNKPSEESAGRHSTEVTVGATTVTTEQYFDHNGQPTDTSIVWSPEWYQFDAIDTQEIRDFAAALLKAAETIEHA